MGFDPFKFIRILFESIGKAFTMIGQINELIECPIRLFSNIETCAYFFLLDYLMIILHFYIKWGICFWVIWIPCWIVLTAFQICFYSFIPGLWDLELTVDMCCPSKDTLCFIIEFINTSLLKKSHLLQRSGDDLYKCYCIEPVRMLFDPYTNFVDWIGSGKSGSSYGDFIMAIFILSLVMLPYIIYGKKKSSS